MKEKIKTVTIGDTRYQIRRFTPDVGSFILGKLVGATLNAAPSEAPTPTVDVVPPSPEETIQMLFFSASFRGLDFDTHRFIQTKALSVCSRLESKGNSEEYPMPIVSDSGVWAIPEIKDDISLVMRLELASLTFNFVDFFAEGGLKELTRTQASGA
jgi:hypothetical protein